MEHAEVVRRMVLFDKGDARRIQHFLKVYMFAALIGKMEGRKFWKLPQSSMI